MALSGYLLYRYFFYTCCALPPKSAPIGLNDTDGDSVLNNPDLLYAKRAFIGFCRTRSGDGGSCHYNTYLYSSGEVIETSSEVAIGPEGERATTYPVIERKIGKNLMEQITKKIRDSEIIRKSCDAEMVTDVYINYVINLDGVKKKIKFPGCESELKEIDALIDTVVL